MKLTTEATIHYCDGCGKSHVQLHGDDMPSGLYMDVVDLSGTSADTGPLFACSSKCLPSAFRRRYEVWHPESTRSYEEIQP